METVRHSLMDNLVQIYLRPGSPHWQCSCSINGQQRRATTKQESLARAKDVARDWYLGLMGKYQAGELRKGKTFNEVADVFTKEYTVITQGERNERYVKGKGDKVRVHLGPFFGNKIITEITPGMVQDYRVHRMTSRKDANGKPLRPSRSTLHQEIVTLRQILKTANRHGWLPYLPDLSMPYKSSGKISHRAWFSKEEYELLYKETGKRAQKPPRMDDMPAYEDLHDFVLFMANTGLRPDEAHRLEYRDVTIVIDEPTGETILEIEVRGKRGVGYCKSMPGAVFPFSRLKERKNGQPADRLFPKFMNNLLNAVLESIKLGTGPDGKPLTLKKDREGQSRTAYSLRHTYICLRLMEGADIYQIAKNCRTSVEMIEKYYASHIKNRLDASAINVRRSKPSMAQNESKDVENRI